MTNEFDKAAAAVCGCVLCLGNVGGTRKLCDVGERILAYGVAQRQVGATAVMGALSDGQKILRQANKANNALFDVADVVDDVEHYITCHADGLPEVFRRVAAAVRGALQALQEIVALKPPDGDIDGRD